MKKIAALLICLAGFVGVSRAQGTDSKAMVAQIGEALNAAVAESADEDFSSIEYKNEKLVFTLTPGSLIAKNILMQNNPTERQATVIDLFAMMFQGEGEAFFKFIEEAETPLQLVVPDAQTDEALIFTASAADVRRAMK